MNLSKRLGAIARLVPAGSRAADIGTDHGYVPVWLIENGVCQSIYASDIREGPLKKAIASARQHSVYDKIRFSLSAGLDDCASDEVDTIIIAGMGGESMIEILAAAPWAHGKKLILQPQTKIRQLRRWLHENEYTVTGAQLVEDAGRIYLIWQVEAGKDPPLTPGDFYIDPKIERSGLLCVYIGAVVKNLSARIAGLERAAAPDEAELAFLVKARSELTELRRELENAEGI